MKFPRKSKVLVATLATIGILALSACSGTSTTGSTTSSASPAVSAAKKIVAQYTATQPAISIADFPKPVKKGLTVAITTCNLPVCHTTTDAAVIAAKKLGWIVKQYETTLTPQAYITMWNQVMQTPPDLIAFTAVTPNVTIKSQLAEAAKLHIPVVGIAPAGDRPDKTGPMSASYNGYPEFYESGYLMGNVVVANGGNASNTIFVWDASLSTIWNPIKDGFMKAMKTTGSTPPVLNFPSAGIGSAVPGQVTSYLQSHPAVKFVDFALADYTAGVPQALKAAGISVKIVSRAPQAANLADVKNGTEFATVGEENSSNGWRAIDGLARLSMGETPGGDWFEPVGWHQIYVKGNVTETTAPPTTPGSPSAFLKAWGLS